jgi:Tfp pilus assembly ATPase PilU
MTDNPAPTPPRQPLVLPPNFRDVTAERIGTVIGIVGVTGAGKGDEGSA